MRPGLSLAHPVRRLGRDDADIAWHDVPRVLYQMSVLAGPSM
jgi:hypothetical protein